MKLAAIALIILLPLLFMACLVLAGDWLYRRWTR